MSIPESLKRIIGHKVVYEGKKILVTDYALDTDVVILISDESELRIRLDNFKTWIDQLSYLGELPAKQEEKPNQSIMLISDSSATAKELKDILMENINKVKEDKEYIAQAQEINRNVNSIIDIEKQKIEWMKMIKNK